MVGHPCTADDCRLFWMAGLLVSMACATGIGTLEGAIQVEPRSARRHFQLGAAAFESGDAAKALLHFETAATLDPTDFLASYDAGLIRQLRGEDEEARRWFFQAAQANPQDWRTRGKSSKRCGNWTNATGSGWRCSRYTRLDRLTPPISAGSSFAWAPIP